MWYGNILYGFIYFYRRIQNCLYVVIFFLFSLVFSTKAQKNTPYNELRFEQFTIDHGLSSNTVNCFLQDKQGFIWIGTSSGLNRFDGYHFKIYQHDPTDSTSISAGDINCIYQDDEGMLWIGTGSGGLNRFDPQTEKFKSWLHNDTLKSSIPANTISKICAGSDHTLWLGSSKGLIQFNCVHESFRSFQHEDKDANTISGNGVNTVLVDNNRIWIGTFGKGINVIDIRSGKVTRLKTFASGPIPGNRDYVHEIVRYNDTMLIALNDFGLTAINPFTLNITILLDSIQALNCIKDENGWLWIAAREGLVLFDPVTKTKIQYDTYKLNTTDAHDNTTSVYKSSDGTYWIGKLSTGFHRVNPTAQNFHILKAPITIEGKKPGTGHGNNNYIMSFAEDDDSCLWIGTFNEGLHQFIKKNEAYRFARNFDNYNSPVTNPFPIVLLKGSGNDLWQGHFGGGEGVVRFNTQNYKIEILERFANDGDNAITENNCTALMWDSSGILWIGMPRFGLDKYDTRTKTFTHYKHDESNPKSIAGTWINAIRQHNNVLWIGSNGGLSKLNEDGSFTNYRHKNDDLFSLEGEDVSCMNFDREGRLWIGTLSGDLNVFKPSENKFLHAKLYAGKKKGAIAGLLIDDAGKIWLSTDAGITTFIPPRDLDNFFLRDKNIVQSEWDSLFHDFDKADGLPFTVFNEYSYYKGKDGKLYFGSQEGAVVIDPVQMFYNKQPPAVVFTAFSVLNKEVTAGDSIGTIQSSISYADEIVLHPRQSVFSIEFSALNFIASVKNKFAYKLEGFDENWVETDYTKRSATYTALSPGHYTFHVKASNNDGVWNETGKSISIIIKPAWWQTLFFRITFVFTLASLIFFATRYYFRQKLKLREEQLKLQEEQHERERAIETIRVRISQDIHDEIGSNLTKISLMSQRIKLSYHKQKEIDETLINKITESSKEVVNNFGEIIWAVNPKHDNLQSLLAYLRNYIINFFEQTNIDCMIYFPDEVAAVAIAPDLKHNLFLVIKESLNNILKHAAATEVKISFQFSSQTFCFEITDNGKGITDMNGRDFGNGLMNMKNRMKAVNGKFEIESEKNKGTKIILEGHLL
jgi:signal transduction histidine kinase/ligand-binding sensor domain-containing protein